MKRSVRSKASFSSVSSVSFMEVLESRTLLSVAPTTITKVLLQDEFNTKGIVSAAKWHQPTWTGNGDGTYLGRTQLTVTQDNSPLKMSGGALHMTLNKFTPTMSPGNPAFHGTQETSNSTFTIGNPGVTNTFEWRAKLNTPAVGGYVVGLFLYYVNPDGTHNEIDFELVSNRFVNGSNTVCTNVYSNEPLGAGTPKFYALPKGKLNAYHVFTLTTSSNKITWSMDGKVVRTETAKVPTGLVQVYENMWTPDSSWDAAYNSAFQPVSSKGADKQYSADIDYFKATSITPVFTTTGASISVSPTAVDVGGAVTGKGTVAGTGNGNVSYVWMVKKPDGTSSQVGTTMTAAMTNGTAVITDFTGLPTDTSGNCSAWIHITNPKSMNSSAGAYTVNVPFTVTDAETDISNSSVNQDGEIVVNQGDIVTANGVVNGTGSSTVNYIWVKQGSQDSDPTQVGGLFSTKMIDGTAAIPDFTGLPTAPADIYRVWIVIPGTDTVDEIDSTSSEYTVTVPFTIASAVASVTPAVPVTTGPVSVNGVITGSGDGDVTYHWETTSSVGNPTTSSTLTTTMVNGVAVVPDFAMPNDSGAYSVVLSVDTPAVVRSDWIHYMVVSPITNATVNFVTASTVNKGDTLTVNGIVNGISDGTVTYDWEIQGYPTGNSKVVSDVLTTTMTNGVANISNFNLPTDLVGSNSVYIRINSPVSTLSPSVKYTVQPTAPGIYISQVAPLGASGTASGLVYGLDLSQYDGVAIYLLVSGVYWTKPWFSNPLTTIASDGTWSNYITTGGYDTIGTEVRAYLIPKGFAVPLVGGGSLPSSLDGLLYAVAIRS